MAQLPLLFPPSSDRLTSTVAPLLYPMFLMPMRTLLDMAKMTTHQELLRQGKLGECTSDMGGRLVFISHQWLGYRHPDPAGEQLGVLQLSLIHI